MTKKTTALSRAVLRRLKLVRNLSRTGERLPMIIASSSRMDRNTIATWTPQRGGHLGPRISRPGPMAEAAEKILGRVYDLALGLFEDMERILEGWKNSSPVPKEW